ncbi:zinc ribbon domain-containing protein [Heyndrickxia vini]|uniref:Zinc ribbon domain-containing protein n=1 Tax=Heyndrickxia vini TaxID=1476025 RepID=A0ABX7DVY3_9BACI|nr:zinc ribbon domain-containing protein [Heyndrickxia vini]QQZ07606.1 zinc ribbon domain-containing protein [Heyndrickxia vini]
MPSYTFHCKTCGNFTLFFSTMKGNKSHANCPNCSLESNRVYYPPNLYSYSKELRTRIERGMEPRKMTIEELGPKRTKKSSNLQRPWQVGH